MIEINYNRNRFEINFTERMESDEFQNILFLFKRIYLTWDRNNSVWHFQDKRIDEIIMWFERDGIEYTISQSAIEQIHVIKNSYKKELVLNRMLCVDKSIFNQGIKLFDFQEDGINWALKRNRVYFADDPGLGKSMEALSVFGTLYKKEIVDSAFIIVPSGLSYHWKHEILEFLNLFKEDDIAIIENANKHDIFGAYKDKKIIVIVNHLLADAFAYYRNDKVKIKKLSSLHWDKPYVDIKKEWNKKNIFLIVDEAHSVKSPLALKTKALLAHKEMFERRVFLSATPAINHFEDWWVACQLVDESFLSMSYNAFKISIANRIGDNYSVYNIKSYNENKIQEVKDKLGMFVLKRLKKDIPEMKAKQIIRPIYIKMTDSQKRIYQDFLNETVYKWEQEYDDVTIKLVMQKFPYILQAVDNIELLKGKIENVELNARIEKWKFENDARITYVDMMLQECIEEQNQKVIIFDHHPVTLNSLYARYQKYNPIILHGETGDSPIQRQQKQDMFNDKNSKYKLFVLSTIVGGQGLNLNKACSRAIFFTLPYDATLTRQAQDRIYRITNIDDALIDILILDKTIDSIRYRKNYNRIELNDNLLDKALSKADLKILLEGIL